jgi:hypothetical protein
MTFVAMWFLMGFAISFVAVGWPRRLLYVALGPLSLPWHLVIVPRREYRSRARNAGSERSQYVTSPLREYGTVALRSPGDAERTAVATDGVTAEHRS